MEILIIKKKIFIDKNIPFEIDQNELSKRKISKRELEVLHLIAERKSNQEIADTFVSLPTIKTHVANLFEKLNAKRHTQAIETANKFRNLK